MKMREIRELMRTPRREPDRVERKLSRCHEVDDLRPTDRRRISGDGRWTRKVAP